MRGLMRSCPGAVRNTITAAALGFVMLLPSYEPAAHALPQGPRDERTLVAGKEPQDQPRMQDKNRPKTKEAQDHDPSPILASFRITTGTAVIKALRVENYDWLVQHYKNLDPLTPRITSAKEAADWVAAELKIFEKSKEFSPDDQLAILLASVSLHSGTLLRTWSLEEGDKKLSHAYTTAYVGSIRSLGFQRLAGTVEDWLKNGNGDTSTLYKGMHGCMPTR